MAHNLKRRTNYRIIKVDLAVPEDIDDATLADGLNEMLRPGMLASDAVFHDYQLNLVSDIVRRTDDAPEEGELFNQATLDTSPRVYQLEDVQGQIDDSKPKAAPLSAKVEVGGDFIAFDIAGCGLRDMETGDGRVVLLENRSGKPFLMVWADINDGNPTDEIDLSGALESERIED